MKRFGLLAMVAALWLSMVPQANAVVWSGTCLITARFNFSSPIRSFGTAPNYSINVGSVADLDPRSTGTQSCAVTQDPLEIGRATAVSASGTSIEWSCSAAVASGSWNQQWITPSGSSNPPSMFGSHTIDGTWGHWTLTMTADDLSVVGVAELTVHPMDATKVAQCPLVGLTSLTMVGELVFQDP